MIRPRTRISYSLAVSFFGAAALAVTACGDSAGGTFKDDPWNGGDGNGDGGKVTGNGDSGTTKPGDKDPPVVCGGTVEDAPADELAFANNQIASPAPPGNLDPKNAPQIVVFGWDDVEAAEGIAFVNELVAGITNPNKSKGGCNLNPNACYGYSWANAPAGTYICGPGTLAGVKSQMTSAKFDMGNHTVDHLEENSTWSGIPKAWQNAAKGWIFKDGFGPGIALEQSTWETLLKANDAELKALYGTGINLKGFRAPRLELNDQGLNALKAIGYEYDEDLEELLPEGYVDAVVNADTAGKKGFNFVPWPYTLDNGSPGIWIQHAFGDKKYVNNYPNGIWEIPVYQAYVPAKDGKAVADAMLAADKDCVFPPGTPDDEQTHCFLSDGELNPGDSVKEVSSFDFNTFIYARMTPELWLATMKHTFLARYYGNRAPLTYGAHPAQYTASYDNDTLNQGNNWNYKNVLKYNTFTQRKQAMKDFVQWIKSDPALSKDTYFMSAQQLVNYMKSPIDKTGAKVAPDTVATPASNGIFERLGWTTEAATIKTIDGNSADITFNVKSLDDAPPNVSAGITPGALKGVSHIDIKYSTEVPLRVRLFTKGGGVSTTVLLAGVGGDRLARIRVKDFFPGPEATAAEVGSAPLVDADYMAKVSGISFEAAPTMITGTKSFTTKIQQITLHGVATADLCSK
jgi:hypothetical protein